MKILGLNVFHADTSACIIKDGKLIAAVEEERFTRIKHFTGFPKNSIDFCLKEGNLRLNELDLITVNYNKNYNLNEKLIFSLKNFFSSDVFNRAIHSLRKPSLKENFLKFYGIDIEKKIQYIPHHLSHISSSFHYHEINNAIGFSIDGSGDFSTTEIYKIDSKQDFELIEKVNYPHSLGIFYQAMTQFLGFKNYGDEYKVMGLAPYGNPIYKDRIKKIIYSSKNFFELNLKYFDHHKTVIDYDFNSGVPYFEDLYSIELEKLFGKSRKYNEEITNFHMDIAASLQEVFEDIIINKLNKVYEKFKIKNLCLSGGCIFNSSLNGKIENKTKFENIFLSPNVGDAGGSIGSALYVASKNKQKIKYNKSPYLGTHYSDKEIEKKIIPMINNLSNLKAVYYKNFDKLCEVVTNSIVNNGVVGWFQDKMEWGPRALGNRSILGDPRDPNMREIINLKIKRREEFRPFAPSVLEEEAENYFLIKNPSPFMTSVFQVKNEVIDKIPAVVHINNTARVQTISQKDNNKYYTLINKFYEVTGIPMLLNTSLNVDEPICENPNNAFEVFTKTSMDMLVLQNWVLSKNS